MSVQNELGSSDPDAQEPAPATFETRMSQPSAPKPSAPKPGTP